VISVAINDIIIGKSMRYTLSNPPMTPHTTPIASKSAFALPIICGSKSLLSLFLHSSAI
jgi:hypothetical protein